MRYHELRKKLEAWKSASLLLVLALFVCVAVMVVMAVQFRSVSRSTRNVYEASLREVESRANAAVAMVRFLEQSMDVLNIEYAGEFMCTAYCTEKYEHVCGTGDGITSSGQPVQAGVTVAADPNVFPYGTVLYIEGVGIRVVQDTGGSITGNRLDIAVDTHESAIEWAGYGEHKVYVISVPEG